MQPKPLALNEIYAAIRETVAKVSAHHRAIEIGNIQMGFLAPPDTISPERSNELAQGIASSVGQGAKPLVEKRQGRGQQGLGEEKLSVEPTVFMGITFRSEKSES
jgi:hypothetical protein